MKKISKRILALLLAAVMLLPIGIFSESPFVTNAEAASYDTITLNVPWYSMRHAAGCGISSIAMIEGYVKGYGDNDWTCYSAVYNKNSTLSSNPVLLASYAGIGYTGISCSLSEIYNQLKKGNPVLVFRTGGINGSLNHFSVIYGYNGSTSKLEKKGFKIKSTVYASDYSAMSWSEAKEEYDADTNLETWLKGAYWDKALIRTSNKITSLPNKNNAVSQPTSSTSNYVGGVTVTLKTSTSDATIYYTTNGNTPTTSSTKYTGAFNLTSTATVKAIAVKSGMNNSSVMTKKVTVNKTATPTIKNTVTSSGFNITITAEKGATVYYTTDGTTPTLESNKYTGQFSVFENATIKAIAAVSGKSNSSAASAALSASIPAVPTVKLDSTSKSICGIGDNITVSWDAVKDAYEYKAILSKNGQEVSSFNTQSTLATFAPEEAGAYEIAVKAVNFVGESAASSPAVAVTVKPDVKVTFKDYDGSIIEEKTVKYAGSTTAPVPTKRVGHEFKEWVGTYNNVTADSVVTATYTANTYTIVFVDEKGNELSRELVDYGSAAENIPSAPAKTGYKFAAWSVKSGDGDSYTKVNGDVVFEPTYIWSNPDLPLGVSAEKAVRSSDLKSYDVTVKITNVTSNIINGKIIAVIKTANDKVVATGIEAVTIPANAEDYTETVTISGTNDGMAAEVYIVANDPDNSDRTGGAYSERVAVAVTREISTTETYWGEWSEWSENAVAASDTKEVEVKTQYRYRDKQTTTSTSATLSGWTADGTFSTTYGSWGSWSSWSTTKPNGTNDDVKNIETRKTYRYYYFACPSCGRRHCYHSIPCWSCGTTVSSSGKYLWSTTAYKNSKYSNETSDGTKKYSTTVANGGDKKWFFSGGNVNDTAVGTTDSHGVGSTVIRNEYRYRTRTKTVNYNFWKWGDYSDWSDTVYTAGDTRQVETRTVYRYRNLMERASTGSSDYIVTEDLSGKAYTVSGALSNVSADYSGKIATVMVYKDRNTDPTESQIEYIGQITLGSGNSYDFTFIPKEAISSETGNYIVSFGIATASGLVNNVEVIEAPKPSYKVDFFGIDGNLLSSQTVEKGDSATAPEAPEAEGNEVRWDRTFTNITAATSVKAEAIAKTYNLVFVDWANDEIVKMTEAKYGDKIELPADRDATGKKFIGWSVDENATVTGNMVIEAVYEDISFTATFLNRDGSVYETQTVHYGNAVTLPVENPTEEGYEFLAWSNESNWWNVTENITIEPVFIYDSTVETPLFVLTEDTPIGFAQIEIETSTEDAEIRYTTDGTEPTEESILFEDVIFVEETTTFKAKAFKSGMNASQAVENTFEVIPSAVVQETKVSAVTDNSNYEIGKNYAKICMRIDNPYEYEISSWGYVITNTSTDETTTYENTSIAGIKDKVIGRAFTINELGENESYSYYFFVNFKEIGIFESGYSTFTTSESPVTFSMAIRTPSITTIKYGDTIVLHADVSGKLPAGSDIVWTSNNENFGMTESGDGTTCRISPKSSGDTTFTATVYDSNGNVLASDTQVMKSKAGFFDKIAAFFRGLFGLTKDFPQLFKAAF